MRTTLIAICIMCISSCASRIDTATWQKEADAYRTELMRTESDAYGDFFKLRIFHSDLMQSVMDTGAAPYPSLDQLFHNIIPDANGVVSQRMVFDTTYFALQKNFQGKKTVKKKAEVAALHDTYEKNLAKLRESQLHHKSNYDLTRKTYQDTCLKYGIRRIGPEDYAVIINEKIMAWQDSLEQVGKMIASAKSDLKKRFTDHKSKAYFSAYRPISDLEVSLKQFDSMLAQMQNSLSRFEEGNREDFIYFGTGLRPRLEVQATEDLFIRSAILMQQCREQASKYYRAFE
jgi:hypothetical protein